MFLSCNMIYDSLNKHFPGKLTERVGPTSRSPSVTPQDTIFGVMSRS